MPQNRGTIDGQNTYLNPALGLTIRLPGQWYFFDRTSHSSPEQKQKEKEMEEQARANCTGALCGPGDIDVALRSPAGPMPPVYAIYIGGHKLSAEYQNRERHPLKEFARIMSLGSLGGNWIPEGELTAIQMGGRPGYRLIVHNKNRSSAKGFLYVAESNGQVFMLLGTALGEAEALQSALEKLTLADFSRGGNDERVSGTTIEILTPTQGVNFTSFVQGISESVKKSWYAKMPDEAKTQKQKGKVLIRFVVRRDGSLEKGSPLVVTGSGVRNLDDAASFAIKDAAPFKGFPQEFSGSNIALEFRFFYNLPAE